VSFNSGAPFHNLRTGALENQKPAGKFEVALARYCSEHLGIHWSAED